MASIGRGLTRMQSMFFVGRLLLFVAPAILVACSSYECGGEEFAARDLETLALVTDGSFRVCYSNAPDLASVNADLQSCLGESQDFSDAEPISISLCGRRTIADPVTTVFAPEFEFIGIELTRDSADTPELVILHVAPERSAVPSFGRTYCTSATLDLIPYYLRDQQPEIPAQCSRP